MTALNHNQSLTIQLHSTDLLRFFANSVKHTSKHLNGCGPCRILSFDSFYFVNLKPKKWGTVNEWCSGQICTIIG